MSSSEKPPEIDEKRVRTKLHHIIKTAQSATKKAKQHELQKLVRRLKLSDVSQDFEQELYYVKNLDVHALALRSLSSKLVKSKLLPKPNQPALAERFPLLPIAKDAGVDSASTESLLIFQDKTHERVAHQVQSSKALAGELNICLQSLIPLLSLQQQQESPASEQELSQTRTKVGKAQTDTHKKVPAETLAKSSNVADDDYESDDGMGNKRLALHDGDMDAMVASGSDADDSDEEEDTHDEASLDSDHSASAMFLPSLNTGFVPATDGDDWSDTEADYADTGSKGAPKSQRKNRRGQRERRAIWEKKYGRHANHLKLREKDPPKRTRTHYNDKNETNKRPQKRAKSSASQTQPSTAAHQFTSSHKASKDLSVSQSPDHNTLRNSSASTLNAIHPSWAAKQRVKDAQMSATPRGKKIVFD